MTRKKKIEYPGVRATGPYSPALVVGDLVIVSGQGPLPPGTSDIKGTTIEEQARVTLDNVKALLKAAGCSMNDCIKVTVHLSDMANYGRFNKVYTKYFRKPFPCRTLVQSALWHHIMCEVDVIAVKGAGG